MISAGHAKIEPSIFLQNKGLQKIDFGSISFHVAIWGGGWGSSYNWFVRRGVSVSGKGQSVAGVLCCSNPPARDGAEVLPNTQKSPTNVFVDFF